MDLRSSAIRDAGEARADMQLCAVNAQTWAGFDGCGSTASTYAGNSICQQYPSCMGNTAVMMCTNNSSSHLAAYSSSTAKVAATAWNVFKDQTLP